MFLPLFAGANITICGAYCAIMNLKSKCRLPFSTLDQLLIMLQLLCPSDNKLPRTVYKLRKFFGLFEFGKRQVSYCSNCHEEMEGRCHNQACSSSYHEPDVFMQMNITKQLRMILSRKCTHNIMLLISQSGDEAM